MGVAGIGDVTELWLPQPSVCVAIRRLGRLRPGVRPSPRGPFLQGPERQPPPGAEASTRFLWGDTDVQPVATASDAGICFGRAGKGGRETLKETPRRPAACSERVSEEPRHRPCRAHLGASFWKGARASRVRSR